MAVTLAYGCVIPAEIFDCRIEFQEGDVVLLCTLFA